MNIKLFHFFYMVCAVQVFNFFQEFQTADVLSVIQGFLRSKRTKSVSDVTL